MKIQKQRTPTGFLVGSTVLYVSLLAGIVAGQTLNPHQQSSALYERPTSLKVGVQPSISITTSAPSGLSINFAGNYGQNDFLQKDLTVTVSTNNTTGYTLLMNTNTNDTALEHEDNSSYNIPSTTNTLLSPDTLATNTWGYSKWENGQVEAPTTFYAIPNRSSHHLLRTTTQIGEYPDTKLTFAVQLPSNKPAGHYTKQLVFTATTNYVPQDISLTIDTPTEDQVLPAGTTETTLTATTSLNATCKYGTTNTTYDLLPNTFTTTGTKAHSTTIAGLENETTYTYYVSCQTPNDETTVTKGVTFEVHPSDLTTIDTMQEVTTTLCDNSDLGLMVSLKDTRDNTYYRVKKMPDGNCWMVDNLAYDINSAPAQGKPAYNPAPALISSTTIVDTQAQYAQNNNIEGQGQIPNNGNPKASYLYNWCAALGDTSPNCRASATYNATTNPYGAQALQTVLNGTATTTATATNQPEVQGICPAPFRLPKGGLASSPESTPSSTANEFVKLDISMDGLGTNRSSANTYPNFTGTTTDQKDWFGTLSGSYYSSLNNQGSLGFWWSSTASSAASAYNLYLNQSGQSVSPANNNGRYNGFAVRCRL